MAYDTVTLAALLHDLGTFYRRAFPQSDADHAKLGKAVFEMTFAPRLAGLLDEASRREIAAGIAAHHDNWPFLAEADALASGGSVLDPADENPAEPANELLQCPLCRDTTPRPAGAAGRLEWSLRPRAIETADALLPTRSPLIESREPDYRRLWEGFAAEAARLPNGSLGAFGESLTALLEKYAAQVPTSRSRREPFVSLFDHSAWAAALAGCLRRCDGTEPAGGEFILCGVRVGEAPAAPPTHEPVRGADKTAAVRGEAVYGEALLRSLERHLLDALDLPGVCTRLRAGRELAIIGPGTVSAVAAFDAAAKKLAAAAFARHGIMLPLAFAAIPVGRGHLNRFSLSIAALRRAWDVQGRRPTPEVWTNAEARRPAVVPPTDRALSARLGRALRGHPTLVLSAVGDPGAAGAAPTYAPAAAEPDTGAVEFEILGCRWALHGDGPVADAPQPRARMRIALIGPRSREIAFLPPAEHTSTTTVHAWSPAPTVTAAGGGNLPGRGPLRAVFVIALDASEPDLEAAEDPPSLFSHLGRRLDLFFSRAAAGRAADRGGIVLSADRRSIAVTAVAHAALDLLTQLHVDLSQFSGSRPGLPVSTAFTVDRDHETLEEQVAATRRRAAQAAAAGGDRLDLLSESISWADFFELRALADDLLVGPIRERRLRGEVLAELGVAVMPSASAAAGSRRLPPVLLSLIAAAAEDPGLITALQRKLGRLGPRLPLTAAVASMSLGH